MADYQIVDFGDDGDEMFDIDDNMGNLESGLTSEETLDFILDHPDETFAFGEFEVDQAGAISRMETVYGVSR